VKQESQLLKNFSAINFKKCCDIFDIHNSGTLSKAVPQSKQIVGLEMAKKLKEFGLKYVIPGKSSVVAATQKQIIFVASPKAAILKMNMKMNNVIHLL